jgi:hypothetical protein
MLLSPWVLTTRSQVEVPGGQQIFVNLNGALGFTQAHSAYVPPGAYIGGFFNLTYTSICLLAQSSIGSLLMDLLVGDMLLSYRDMLITSRRNLGLPCCLCRPERTTSVSSLCQDPGFQFDEL